MALRLEWSPEQRRAVCDALQVSDTADTTDPVAAELRRARADLLAWPNGQDTLEPDWDMRAVHYMLVRIEACARSSSGTDMTGFLKDAAAELQRHYRSRNEAAAGHRKLVDQPNRPAVLISKPSNLKPVSLGPFESPDSAEWWTRMLRLELPPGPAGDAITIVPVQDTYVTHKSSLGAFWIDPAGVSEDPVAIAAHLLASPPNEGGIVENFPNMWTLLAVKYGIARARALWDAACDINDQNPYFSNANDIETQPQATGLADSPRLAKATVLFTRYMRTAWQAAGLAWGAEQEAETAEIIRLLMDEVNEEIDTAFTQHAEDTPHLYPDGSSA